jgi:hypothetical protein
VVDDIVTEHLSYSRIRSFQICSLAYFFRYVAKEKPAFTPAALAFGSAFHRSVEEALIQRMTGVSPAVDDLLGVFCKALDESEDTAPIRGGEKNDRVGAINQARQTLMAWLTWERPSSRIIAVEHFFEMQLSPWLPKLQGRVDVLEETDEELIISDIKTSRTHWGEDEIEAGRDQLVLYREGLKPLIEEIGKPVRLCWEVIGKVKAPWVERIELSNPPEITRPIRIATLVLEMIEKALFVPSPGWMCSTCPFRDACQGW